jgi:hypothetical protein
MRGRNPLNGFPFAWNDASTRSTPEAPRAPSAVGGALKTRRLSRGRSFGTGPKSYRWLATLRLSGLQRVGCTFQWL